MTSARAEAPKRSFLQPPFLQLSYFTWCYYYFQLLRVNDQNGDWVKTTHRATLFKISLINDSELKMIGVIDKNGVSGSEWKWNLNQEEDIITKSFQSQVEFDRPVGLVLILDRQRGSSSSGEFFANLFTSHTAAADQVGKFGRAKNLGDFSRYQTIGSFLSNLPWLISFQIPSTRFNFFASRCAF